MGNSTCVCPFAGTHMVPNSLTLVSPVPLSTDNQAGLVHGGSPSPAELLMWRNRTYAGDLVSGVATPKSVVTCWSAGQKSAAASHETKTATGAAGVSRCVKMNGPPSKPGI